MVISAGKIGDPSAHALWMNMMQNDALREFSTLLKDVTLSPAMGNYLDMANNDGCNGCSPNENYAREVMQLFSIGLVQLNPDGTPQVDRIRSAVAVVRSRHNRRLCAYLYWLVLPPEARKIRGVLFGAVLQRAHGSIRKPS